MIEIDEIPAGQGRYLQGTPLQSEVRDIPLHSSCKRGVIVLKLESNPTTRRESPGDAIINYVVLSKSPDNPEDPINRINGSIRKVSVIARTPSQAQCYGDHRPVTKLEEKAQKNQASKLFIYFT